jgi:hypothetical protein
MLRCSVCPLQLAAVCTTVLRLPCIPLSMEFESVLTVGPILKGMSVCIQMSSQTTAYHQCAHCIHRVSACRAEDVDTLLTKGSALRAGTIALATRAWTEAHARRGTCDSRRAFQVLQRFAASPQGRRSVAGDGYRRRAGGAPAPPDANIACSTVRTCSPLC